MAVAMFAFGPAAGAQNYPAQTVKLVVPFAPGGATDILARTIGARLSERLGKRSWWKTSRGAGTTIGNAAVAQAAPDGYTLLFAPTPFVISQVMYPRLPYDADKAFTPVTLLAVSPFILVAHPVDQCGVRPGTGSACKVEHPHADVRLGWQRDGPASGG
jgi:tripartite-type tricarboxylate transporter receptor subunit TctC